MPGALKFLVLMLQNSGPVNQLRQGVSERLLAVVQPQHNAEPQSFDGASRVRALPYE